MADSTIGTNGPSLVSGGDAEALAQAERRASARIADTPARWVLAGCVALYAVALFLPFAGEASGWQILAVGGAARDAQTTIAEYLFAWFSLVGLGVLSTAALTTRRFTFAAVGWMVTTISLVFALMAVWLRRSSVAIDTEGHGLGIHLAILAVFVAVFAYIPVVTRRGEEQEAAARERAAAQGTDQVALAQRAATERAERGQEDNPLLIDDRRARAAERHRRQGR